MSMSVCSYDMISEHGVTVTVQIQRMATILNIVLTKMMKTYSLSRVEEAAPCREMPV